MTVTTTAFVPTASGARYIQQLCKHWSHKLEVELTDDRGIVRFPDATATMIAEPEGIAVSLASDDRATLDRMQGVIASHLDRFAFREAPLSFAWN